MKTILATFGHVNISPTKTCDLAGYGPNPWKSIADSLEINGIFIRDGNQSIMILSFDLLYVTQDIKN